MNTCVKGFTGNHCQKRYCFHGNKCSHQVPRGTVMEVVSFASRKAFFVTGMGWWWGGGGGGAAFRWLVHMRSLQLLGVDILSNFTFKFGFILCLVHMYKENFLTETNGFVNCFSLH